MQHQGRLIRAVILDLSGTLIDGNEALTSAWMRVLQEDDVPVEHEKLRCAIGIGSDQFLPVVSGIAPDTRRGQRLNTRFETVFQDEYLPKLKVFQETHALLDRMKSAGLHLIAISSESRPISEKLLHLTGLGELIADHLPIRALLETALTRLGTYPAETLLLADTPYDIEAGLRLGIQTVALRSGGWLDDSLEGAVAVYDDPHDLLKNFEVSPLGVSLLAKGA
jgi:phosphoglycolate phosphatase-like HAD superfamily hydrolase